MSFPIQNFRSLSAGLKPPALLPGQFFVNLADGILYTGDGSDTQKSYDGSVAPGVPGQGWFSSPLSKKALDFYYVANPEQYGDKPLNGQVLSWDATKQQTVWASVEPGGNVHADDVEYNNATSKLAGTDVQAAIDETVGLVRTAQTDATAAGQKADEANAAAGQAQGTANTALTTAQAAETKASDAATAAAEAQTTADEAKTSVTQVKETADTALADANQAQSAASGAVEMANAAKTQAQTAETAADAANTAAVNAQKTADDANTTAGNAQTSAEAAQKTADQAKTEAGTAQQSADAAAATANQALTKAQSDLVAPTKTPAGGDVLAFDGSQNTWRALSDLTQLTSTIYVNATQKDLQTAINEAGLYNTIYVSTGGYGGDDIVINQGTGLNIVGPHCPDGAGIAFIGNSSNRRKILISGSATRIRLTDLVVEGGMIIDGSQGRHSFDNVVFNGPVILRNNVENFIAFEDCSFNGGLTIESTFTSVAGFYACDMGSDQIVSVQTTNPNQVLFTGCSKFLAFPSNATLSGENESITGFSQFIASKITGDEIYTNKSTPASATAEGEPGRVCWDENYIYVCIAPDTWRRARIDIW